MQPRTFLLLLISFLGLLLGCNAQHLGPRDVDRLPASPVTATISYGADPNQVGDLRLPAGKGPFPVVVVVHGGCWTKGFAARQNTAALASALTAKGYATWNIDYRQVGDAGGGWPGTFLDWANGTDYLRTLAKQYPLDLARVGAVGHSAGAHAALWIAGRPRLPKSSEIRGGADPLPVRAAVAIDGPGDLAAFIGADAEICGLPVIGPLMGGMPRQFPQRYKEASPVELLPLHARQSMVVADVLSPYAASEYKARAAAAGEIVDVLNLEHAGHFNVIAPGSTVWPQVEAEMLKTLQ